MFGDRGRLSQIWLEHHVKESNEFSRCLECPCRSVGRIQRLWQTGMTPEDYILFLAENSWIWTIEPGWAMEPKLKDQPDSYERGQILCIFCLA